MRFLVIATLIAGCLVPWIVAEKVVFCYMVAWAVGRPDLGKFSVLDADTEHCTHITYAFMGLDEVTGRIKTIDPYIDHEMGGKGQNQLAKLKELRHRNPHVKILASIGGWNEGGKKFSDVAASPEKRRDFIESVMEFLREHELDGIDICWQFPGQRGGIPKDKENSVILFQELKNYLNTERKLLTLHIIGKRYVMDGYNIAAVSRIADFINLAAVEYSGPWERTTGIFAPLKAANELSVTFSVDYMLSKGAIPEKLLLGLPLYGHAYVLEETPTADASSPETPKLVGLFSDKTFSSQWTNQGGITGFHETCYNMNHTEGWNVVWDKGSQTPLAYNGKKYITFDNKQSLLLKANLVQSRSLGGVMFWSLDMDDFRGLCFGTKYPMVTAVSNYINHRHHSTLPKTTPSSAVEPLQAKDEYRDEEILKPIVEDGSQITRSKVMVCYLVAWSAGRHGAGKFSVSNAETDHCTHIIYAFMTIDKTTNKISSVDEVFDRVELPKLKELKRTNRAVKVLASIGGWGQGSERFSQMAESPEKRRIFIDSVLEFIKKYELDGIDMCWQFPTQRGGKQEDKQNSLTLFKEMKRALGGHLLTIHVLGQKYVIDSYDIKAVSEVVDYINFAAVEYHGPWGQDKTVEITTPLASSDDSNVKANLDYILNKGVSPKKILLGLAAYGHAYYLAEEPRGKYLGLHYDHIVTSQWTKEPGLIAYNEVCYEMTRNKHAWQEAWEDLSLTPLAYKDRLLVSYDNVKSLLLKAKFVHDKNLAGVMIWSIDMDDFQGLCYNTKYPLVKAVSQYINRKPGTPLSYKPKEEENPAEELQVQGPERNSSVLSYEYGKNSSSENGMMNSKASREYIITSGSVGIFIIILSILINY